MGSGRGHHHGPRHHSLGRRPRSLDGPCADRRRLVAAANRPDDCVAAGRGAVPTVNASGASRRISSYGTGSGATRRGGSALGRARAEGRRGIRPGDVQRVFVVKHVLVSDLARVLSVFPAELSGRDNMHVLSVSAAPAVVAAIEETIKRLDVPPPPTRSVEVTLYVLECSVSADAG